MDAWTTIRLPIGVPAYFQVLLLLVSGRVVFRGVFRKEVRNPGIGKVWTVFVFGPRSLPVVESSWQIDFFCRISVPRSLNTFKGVQNFEIHN